MGGAILGFLSTSVNEEGKLHPALMEIISSRERQTANKEDSYFLKLSEHTPT